MHNNIKIKGDIYNTYISVQNVILIKHITSLLLVNPQISPISNMCRTQQKNIYNFETQSMCLKLLFTHLEIQAQNVSQAPLVGGWSRWQEQEAEQTNIYQQIYHRQIEMRYCGSTKCYATQMHTRTLERSPKIYFEWYSILLNLKFKIYVKV